MRIQEIQRKPASPSDNWSSTETHKEVEGLQMVPDSDRYGYVDYDYSNKEKLNLVGADKAITFYDTKPEGAADILYIGYLELRNIRFHGVKKAVQVSNVSLDQRYRGKGIGTMMYTTALQLGYTIIADETQTPSSRRMWVNLSQTHGVSVKGVITLSKQYVDVENTEQWNVEEAKKNRERLEKIGAKPLAPLEKYGQYDRIPFVFPVTPGKDGKELAAQGLKLYTSGEDIEDFISIYAKWIG